MSKDITNVEEFEYSQECPNRLFQGVANIAYAAIGFSGLLLLWQALAIYLAETLELTAFESIAPKVTLTTMLGMLEEPRLWNNILASLSRILEGLAYASIVGGVVGVLYGTGEIFRKISHLPFQFLRMVSPLSWMPLAVLFYATWHGAIVFLIAVCAVWPIIFSLAAGIRKIEPGWLLVSQSFGAGFGKKLKFVILPAVIQDFLAGFRLALGVSWIVLVPCEYLGVTSGLGYAINDSRDTLEYDRLMALILIIGALGFTMDSLLGAIARRFQWNRGG